MYRLIYIIIFSSLLLVSCQNNQEGDKVKKLRSDNPKDLIRNPIQSDGSIDSSQLAQIHFDNRSYDFGMIQQGDTVRQSFKFTNKGQAALLISEVRSTCGCTVPEWPSRPIQPGDSGIIEVLFDSATKEGRQNKPITVIANTIPNESKLYLRGFVQTSEEDQSKQ